MPCSCGGKTYGTADCPLPDRGSRLWDLAWSVLVATGRDIDDGWMLMQIEVDHRVPGAYRYWFKNHSLPFMDGDPAYDGKSKYVILPPFVDTVVEAV